MLTTKLFREVLVSPQKSGADRLLVVSGYASPAMARRHFEDSGPDLKVSLLVGMPSADGLSEITHSGFRQLATADFKDRFQCLYVTQPPAVHSKVYVWLRQGRPHSAFAGSANYSLPAFFERREAMADIDPRKALAYYRSIELLSVNCLDGNIDKLIRIFGVEPREQRRQTPRTTRAILRTRLQNRSVNSVLISLLDNQGNLPTRSGLNWGQRPEYRRNPDQAYIRIPAWVAQSGFFPPRGQHFTLLTDDRNVFTAAIAQDGDKAIATPSDNSQLGRYFRQRLGVPSGSPVTIDHFESYGRTDLEFVKIDDESYYMDFGT